jgi:3'(2'), 5'-bisphosphate nucleotidase
VLTPTPDDLLARDLAVAAGERLLRLRARLDAPGPDGRGGSDAAAADRLRREADRSSHLFIAAKLAAARPGDSVLSEEGKDDPSRLAASRVWIVDPLDGTREYGEAGRTDWAVHIALWERGALTAGAVALPAQGQVLSTADIGLAREGDPPVPTVSQGRLTADRPAGAAERPLRLVVSRSRPPEFAAPVAERIGAVLVPLGSAGAKAAAVISGTADAYVHSGGQYEWDSAAPVAVARAAGLHASRIDGSSLAYNQADPTLPDILIAPAGLVPRLLAAIAAAGVPARTGPAADAD